MANDTREASAAPVIAVRGASEHNLKQVDVDIPRHCLAVVTGVSGSGKSSLAFDTICAEGRRRYLETFSSYARQFLGKLSRPSVRHIDGLSPAVAVDQSTVVRNPRSTVGTMTELYDLLRLLWARLGTSPLGAGVPKIERQLFSFNSPYGACPVCKGLGVEDRLDPDLLVADPAKTVRGGALRITTPTGYLIYSQVTIDVLDQVCRAHGFTVDLPWNALTPGQRDIILNGSDRIRIPYGKHPLASRMKWTGITAKPREEGIYKGILPVMEQILRQKRNDNILRFVRSLPCRACGGTRLRPEALAVTVRGMTIAGAAALSIDGVRTWFEQDGGMELGARPQFDAIKKQVADRCAVLQRLGLGYLTIDRESTTLSSGEAHRIRLARAAGIGLRGVLYVLDEPSVGLHHRDTGRVLDLLRTIRDEGNTVLVVEHDDQVVRQADWIVDVGPGAGAEGGEILFSGPLDRFLASDGMGGARLPDSRTRAFLTGHERIAIPERRRTGRGELTVRGLSKHNLDHVSAIFLLGAFNVVTGVSGAGKSTLIDETRRLLSGQRGGDATVETPEPIDKIIDIDQAPIGRTPRSNPATYTGLFDRVRDLFASQPAAVERGFEKGRFSFNVKGGRCDTCEGAGVTEVGMQFLGSVAVTCERCGGRRFNDETLDIRYLGRNIHDVLEMPVAEACGFFADQPLIARALDTMRMLGLGYLPIGHPATQLSGGEAQRVKLASELSRPGTGRTLYVLDEPTTGLHAADVALLLKAIDGLVSRGNTVIAIEHHLDVIKVADHVVDLGPESGSHGGRVVATGTPEQIAGTPGSFTGEALREALRGGTPGLTAEPERGRSNDGERRGSPEPIRFANVCTHNLRHLDVEIPANRITVITGVSGSGKSSLAFDTIFAEGQQRFADSFSTYARRFVQRANDADFDSVSGLTPTIAISQQAPSRNPRSTVGTLTEIHDHYRLIYSRAGVRHCPGCHTRLNGGTCGSCGYTGTQTLTSAMFSPNSEAGACPACHGLGQRIATDPARLITDETRSLAGGAMSGHKPGRFYGDPHGQHMAILASVGAALGIDYSAPWGALESQGREVALGGTGDREFDVEWKYKRGAREGSHHFRTTWPGLLELVRQEYERKHGDRRGEAIEPLMMPAPCTACHGGRLKPEALAVRFAGVNIHELLIKTVDDTLAFFHAIDAGAVELDSRTRQLTAGLREDVLQRLESLRDAGLGYLALNRPASTLSGGEAQRVRLAAELRSGLTGITYVLDEPTVGLHPRDTNRLLALLRALRDAGNTVIVVEHDLDVIAAADHVIEIGPAAGKDGGTIVALGTPADITRHPASRTGAHLRRTAAATRASTSPSRALQPGITIRGARAHNLRDLDIEIPTGGLVAITGVSGSGKSSLVFDVLAPSVGRAISAGPDDTPAPVNCGALVIHSPVARMIDIESANAVSSPWSTPATHLGVFDPIRAVFADTDEARTHGLRKADFSTSGKGGRCEACEGLGQVRISMDFLPDVWMTCDECSGKRYGAQVLACRIDGVSIADVLDMTIDEARVFFSGRRTIATPLAALHDVGLGYIRLGQPTRTLSGGEGQRLVLASALIGRADQPTLYLFDEPTKGLHADDVGRLLEVFDGLVAAGHSLVVVEHNLDVIRHADWVIDLGPEGGADGGRLVIAGPPFAVAACASSHTGRALRTVSSWGCLQ
ncbi:MAG: excinuclease ABC subunit UvrA [Acidobacteria bacterium]|nr:excinuclease ABC subunit UvrA [Acidobacteriota bacterium]